MFDRIKLLIGEDNLEKIQSKKILIVGIGGVGGTTYETLLRSGITDFTLIDFDTFDETNLNRQVLANLSNVGEKKVNVAIDYAKRINKHAKVLGLDIFLDDSNINQLSNYDYIIDACDSTKTKILLMNYALEKQIPIISSMGMGNRIDPSKIVITTLDKTNNDPLAKKIRNIIKDTKLMHKINVVCSTELPFKTDKIISSMMPVPSTAGIYMAYFVLNDILKK